MRFSSYLCILKSLATWDVACNQEPCPTKLPDCMECWVRSTQRTCNFDVQTMLLLLLSFLWSSCCFLLKLHGNMFAPRHLECHCLMMKVCGFVCVGVSKQKELHCPTTLSFRREVSWPKGWNHWAPSPIQIPQLVQNGGLHNPERSGGEPTLLIRVEIKRYTDLFKKKKQENHLLNDGKGNWILNSRELRKISV